MQELMRMFRLWENYEPRERRQVIIATILEIECIFAVIIGIIAIIEKSIGIKNIIWSIEEFLWG